MRRTKVWQQTTKETTFSSSSSTTTSSSSSSSISSIDHHHDTSEKMSKAVYVIFFSLLLDLFAFTMILPLLPSLLEYYENHDKSGLYPFMAEKLQIFQQMLGAPEQFNAVLFGGLIGSMFSFLQFLASPIFGALSDVYGRKKMLLISMVGEAISYSIWAVSSNFTVFVLARIVGGISKGNVGICTAVITDVSTPKTRGKGMAMIGAAFSIGFIIGPLAGAMFARWGKTQTGAFFTIPALFALILVLIDIAYLAICFKETLVENQRIQSVERIFSKAYNYISPSALFGFHAVQNIKPQELDRMQKIGKIYFLYLFLYSGLEYTLTFLTHTRFQYSSIDQGKMFFFVGIIMACVQGGYVRRISPGNEKKTAVRGLALIVPSFAIIGMAPNTTIMYAGLMLYSFASATVVPCLTTIVSGYGPQDQKGTVLGIFRSLGALARSLGPIVASTAFWILGATSCYMIGGVLLIMPLILLKKLQA